MNEYKLRQLLEDGNPVYFRFWTFSKDGYTCTEGCCNDSFLSIDDAIERIKLFVDDDLDGLKLLKDEP